MNWRQWMNTLSHVTHFFTFGQKYCIMKAVRIRRTLNVTSKKLMGTFFTVRLYITTHLLRGPHLLQICLEGLFPFSMGLYRSSGDQFAPNRRGNKGAFMLLGRSGQWPVSWRDSRLRNIVMLRLHWHIFSIHFLHRSDTFYLRVWMHRAISASRVYTDSFFEWKSWHVSFSAHTSPRGKCVKKYPFTLANFLHSRKCVIKMCQCKRSISSVG